MPSSYRINGCRTRVNIFNYITSKKKVIKNSNKWEENAGAAIGGLPCVLFASVAVPAP